MAGYVDPFAHRLRRKGGRELSDGTDELEPFVDLAEGATEDAESARRDEPVRSDL